MRKTLIVLLLWINLFAGCKKEPIFDEYGAAGLISMTIEDGSIAKGDFLITYVDWSGGPCAPSDSCLALNFRFSLDNDNTWESKALFITNIPSKNGLYKFSKMNSFIKSEEQHYRLKFDPRDPTVHRNDPKAGVVVYVALEDEFNEFEITHLDKKTGKVEGRFQANLKRYPRVYLRSGGWPPDFVVDTFQTTGSFSGWIWK